MSAAPLSPFLRTTGLNHWRWASFVAAIGLLVAGAEARESATPTHLPDYADVSYGSHPRQKLDVWRVHTAEPTPVLVYFHGGGWVNGDKRIVPALSVYLEAGISVVSVNYRFANEALEAGVDPPIQWPLADAARALQLIRSRALEWELDSTRITASGESAGGCTALWLAFHDDLAQPLSDDPVARESTRLFRVAVALAQTTLDPLEMKAWIPNIEYGGHAFGFMPDPRNLKTRDTQFEAFLAARERLLPWINRYSPYANVTLDDPPVYLFYTGAPAVGQPQTDSAHSANFGVMLEARLRQRGVACELVYPGAPDVSHSHLSDYVIEHSRDRTPSQ